MQDYFAQAPEFITEDNRQHRSFNPVSHEQQTKKHRALFPDELVRGKTVLDLGSCTGATGYWCLAAGATHYTGVEFQETYARESEERLGKYFPGRFTIVRSSIEEWLRDNTSAYDVVSLLGVLYVFTDFHTILQRASGCARETVLIESLFHNVTKLGPDFCGVQFVNVQLVNLADEHASLRGRGIRISPSGLAWLMAEFGFGYPTRITPEKISEGVDIFDTTRVFEEGVRFLMKFTRRNVPPLKNLSQDLQGERMGEKKVWAPKK
jgi:hypothetical protein